MATHNQAVDRSEELLIAYVANIWRRILWLVQPIDVSDCPGNEPVNTGSYEDRTRNTLGNPFDDPLPN
jgi:hypothetical protein